MINPALELGKTGRSQGEIWVQLQRAFIELLGLLELWQPLQAQVQVVGLDKSQVGFAVLGRLAREFRLLPRRELRLQLQGDLLCEISLDREDIGQIAIV